MYEKKQSFEDSFGMEKKNLLRSGSHIHYGKYQVKGNVKYLDELSNVKYF
jgi:hypothetical protein